MRLDNYLFNNEGRSPFIQPVKGPMNDLPNLLIISQSVPQTVYAGSILMHRLLKDYPPEKLLVIGPSAHSTSQLLECRYESLKLPLKRLEYTRMARFLRSLRTFGFIQKFNLNFIKRLLKGFQPDIVLSLMQFQPYYQLAYRYAKSQNLPLMLIVHDIPEFFEIVHPWAARQQLAKNAQIYLYASKRLCVSPEMRDYLTEVYGARGDVLYPNRSEDLIPRSTIESRSLKQPGTLTVAYAGSLSYGYGIQLNQMISTFRETGTKLRIYSGDRLLSDAPDVVTYGGYASSPNQTWSLIKQECDAVILPYSWSDDRHQALYKTHFPSKLPEYLALGMPILIVGPEYATGVKWGLQNPKAALIVTDNNPAVWARALLLLKESSSLRETMSQHAVVAGARDFDPTKIRSQFLQHLRETFKNAGESQC